jgi:hypothetical protein
MILDQKSRVEEELGDLKVLTIRLRIGRSRAWYSFGAGPTDDGRVSGIAAWCALHYAG